MDRLLSGILCAILALSAFASADTRTQFETAKLVPDVIDAPPIEAIQVKYGNKSVELGNELTPPETQQVPEIHYKHEGGVLYTLILTDPDIPTRGYRREYCHWSVGNIPEENVAKGEVLAEYVGPAPPKDSGKHRYTFLLYKQNQGAITFDERRLGVHDRNLRKRYSVKKFAEKYNLEGPIAGNYFLAQYNGSA